MSAAQFAFPLAAAGSVILIGAALRRSRPGRREITFALGMAGFALEAIASFALVGWTDTAEDRRLWLRVVSSLGVLLLLPWAAFIASLLAPAEHGTSRRTRLMLWLTSGLVALTSGVIWLREPFLVSELSGAFYAARLSDLGLYPVIAQLLGTVAILAGLELCLRTADRDARWRLKYLLLGLGGVFLVRFYLLSHLLLFHVLLGVYITTQAAALVLATIVIGASIVRAPFAGGKLVISRSIALRSAVVGLLGLYLFVVGGLGWLLDRLGLSEELFWGSVLIFAGAAAAGAITLSEHLRWRFRRFIGMHFYGSKYDYRAQWMTFTRRLGSTIALEELTPQLLAATTDAIGTAKGVLYLAGDDGFHLGAAVEVYDAPDILDASSPFLQRAREHAFPVPVGDVERPAWFPQAAALVPLIWQGSLTGVLIVAGERTDRPYSAEDLEFLAAVGVQVAAAMVTTRLSETVARTREFEAFHRLTSFVVHDLKNAVSGLSMLSQNSLQHFDDPEFQRDAIQTVSRTVDRMRALLRRLTSAAEVPKVSLEPLDLATLLADRIVPLIRTPQVALTCDLRPAPMVGDADALERMFHNLVTNAVEALDGRGQLILRSTVRGETAVCEVSDTGCGMSLAFQRRALFVPFRSSKKGGWGIGLYHAREIVQAHRGHIDVKSAEGQGTTFTVTFPVADTLNPEGTQQ
jgi:putative PEP-CTERM system histidine kinase